MTSLSPAFGVEFSELHTREGLLKLDQKFCASLRDSEPALADQLDAARQNPAALATKAESELLLALAPHLEDFLAESFGIRHEVQTLAKRHHELAPLYECRRRF